MLKLEDLDIELRGRRKRESGFKPYRKRG